MKMASAPFDASQSISAATRSDEKNRTGEFVAAPQSQKVQTGTAAR